jgi:hypothetical protein
LPLDGSVQIQLCFALITFHCASENFVAAFGTTALANVADILSIDWDSIEEVLCDEEDDDVSAVTEVKKLCTRYGQ